MFCTRIGVGDKAGKRICYTYFPCMLVINRVRATFLRNNPFYKLRGSLYNSSVSFISFCRLRGSVRITASVPFN